MKGFVFFMIAVMLAAAWYITKVGSSDSEYCRQIAEMRVSGQDYEGSYGGRFSEFLHGCW